VVVKRIIVRNRENLVEMDEMDGTGAMVYRAEMVSKDHPEYRQ
jgi:hypothetical protein